MGLIIAAIVGLMALMTTLVWFEQWWKTKKFPRKDMLVVFVIWGLFALGLFAFVL
jgi:hypothetical protein